MLKTRAICFLKKRWKDKCYFDKICFRGRMVGYGPEVRSTNMIKSWTQKQSRVESSTLLYYISRSFGYRNIDDRHRNPNINIKEIIWLGNQLGRKRILSRVMFTLKIKHICSLWRLSKSPFPTKPNTNSKVCLFLLTWVPEICCGKGFKWKLPSILQGNNYKSMRR